MSFGDYSGGSEAVALDDPIDDSAYSQMQAPNEVDEMEEDDGQYEDVHNVDDENDTRRHMVYDPTTFDKKHATQSVSATPSKPRSTGAGSTRAGSDKQSKTIPNNPYTRPHTSTTTLQNGIGGRRRDIRERYSENTPRNTHNTGNSGATTLANMSPEEKKQLRNMLDKSMPKNPSCWQRAWGKRKDVAKLLVIASLIVLALATHATAMHYVTRFVQNANDGMGVGPYTEATIRILYPIVIFFVMWGIKVSI
jgi:hypothetical protein